MDSRKAFWTLAVSALFAFCWGQPARAGGDHGHGHEEKGSHGGEIQELGDKDDTHAELVHDQAAGKLTLYLLGKDGKTPVAIKDAPKINLKAKAGNRQVPMKAVNPAADGSASQFEAADEGFKADPLDGRIAITLGGKPYHIQLDAHFGHDHGH